MLYVHVHVDVCTKLGTAFVQSHSPFVTENVPWACSRRIRIWHEDVEEDGMERGSADRQTGRRPCRADLSGRQDGQKW